MNGDEFQAIFSNTISGTVYTATTTAATLTVDNAPIVTSNPSNLTVNAGSNAAFSAAASGNPTPTVQWQISTNGGTSWSNLSNGGAYSGVTTDTLTITGASQSLNGDEFQAIFSNTISGTVYTATTTAATLTVDNAPIVTSNPSNLTVNAGSNAAFSAAASGNPTPTVQWQISTNGGTSWSNLSNGGAYSGVTTDTLTITGALQSLNGDEFQAIFSNTISGTVYTATTTAATLTVDNAPIVTSNPSNLTVNAGSNAAFSAAASGNPTPTVQWQISTNGGTSWSNLSNGGAYSGVTTDTLTITGASQSLNGDEFQAIFSNTISGTVYTATTTAATLTVDNAPIVTSNPSNLTVNAGSNAAFSAAASGNPTPTVQWQISTNGGTSWSNLSNGGSYSGVTTDALTITGASQSLNGDEFQAIFSNTISGTVYTATTTAATLTVDNAPIVTSNPSNLTVNAGSNAAFSAAASGNPTPTVQWEVSVDGGATWTNLSNGGVYSGVTTQTLSITGAFGGDEWLRIPSGLQQYAAQRRGRARRQPQPLL